MNILSNTKNTPDDISYLTLNEVSSILRISRRTLLRMVNDGKVPYRKFGRQLRVPAYYVAPGYKGE